MMTGGGHAAGFPEGSSMSKLAALFRALWLLAKPYWTQSDERRSAWVLLAVIVGINLGSVALSVWFNFWNNNLYHSLQKKDFGDFKKYLLQYLGLAVVFISVAVYKTYITQTLRLR